MVLNITMKSVDWLEVMGKDNSIILTLKVHSCKLYNDHFNTRSKPMKQSFIYKEKKALEIVKK